MIDLKNTTCIKCKKGTYIDAYFFDDMDGTLHCSNTKCRHEVKRYTREAPLTDEEKIEMNKKIADLEMEEIELRRQIGKAEEFISSLKKELLETTKEKNRIKTEAYCIPYFPK